MTETWPLVQQAIAAARAAGFPLDRSHAGYVPGRGTASLPGVGKFLAVLAAGCNGGRIAEFGTGVGIGTAWLASAMPADCTLVTADIDPARAAVAAELFAADARVQVLTGDAQALLAPLAPFDLIFSDCGALAPELSGSELADRVGMLRSGGQIVADDITPVLALAADSPFRLRDRKREQWSAQPGLAWTEVVLPDLANSLFAGTALAAASRPRPGAASTAAVPPLVQQAMAVAGEQGFPLTRQQAGPGRP